jgi:predicted RNA-binding Zn ribbon-like protein
MPVRAEVPEEPLPVRLMNTIYADADGRHDALVTRAGLDRWLDAAGADRAGARATEDDLAAARALRDALRVVAAHVTSDDRPAAVDPGGDLTAALDQVNAIAARLPAPRLAVGDGRLERVAASGQSPVATALARIADQAVSLLGGADGGRLRACGAPGCVLYFTKTHPRREWCSVACGNRVRAARHYQRSRDQRDQPR